MVVRDGRATRDDYGRAFSAHTQAPLCRLSEGPCVPWSAASAESIGRKARTLVFNAIGLQQSMKTSHVAALALMGWLFVYLYPIVYFS